MRSSRMGAEVDRSRGQLSYRQLVLRSATSTYVVFAGLLGPVVALWVYLAATRRSNAWQGAAVASVMFGGVMLHFALLRITVAEGFLRYRSLRGTRSLRLTDIGRSEIRQAPRPLLVITPSTGQRAIRIGLKPFRLDEVRMLLSIPELRLRTGDDVA